MRRLRSSSAFGALVLMAMVLMSCGGGAAPTSTAAETAVTTTSAQTQGNSAEGNPQTISEFFGYPSGDDPEAAQAFYEAQEMKIQELVQTCMAKEGFEYIPAVYPQPDYATMQTSAEDYAKTQGFGITTWYGNEEQMAGPATDWVDPNQEIVSAMSESEQTAYYEVLYGPQDQGEPQVDASTGETYYVSEGFGAGCTGTAQEKIYGNQNKMYTELGPELDAMYQRMQADPRIADANKVWTSCMADKGYSYESSEKMYQVVYEDFQKRFDAIVGPNGGYADPMAGWTQEQMDAFFAEKTQQEIDAFFASAQEEAKKNVDQEALAALQQEERDLAVANAQCSEPLNTVYTELSKEYEAQFVADHRAQLEEMRAAQSG